MSDSIALTYNAGAALERFVGVYWDGADGENVKTATDPTDRRFAGITQQAVADDENVQVVVFGQTRATVSGTVETGDLLMVTTAGALTKLTAGNLPVGVYFGRIKAGAAVDAPTTADAEVFIFSPATRAAAPLFLTGTKTADLAAIEPGANATTTLTVTGAAAGDAVIVNAPSLEDGLVVRGWVSAANTVTIEVAAIDPAILSGTKTVDLAALTQGTELTTTLAIVGVEVGDSVVVTPTATMEAGLVVQGYVSAADTVTITVKAIPTGILYGSGAVDFASTADEANTTATLTVTGAATGDVALVSAPSLEAGVDIRAHVSAANTVTLTCSGHKVAGVDPASQTVYVAVIPQTTSINPASQDFEVLVIPKTRTINPASQDFLVTVITTTAQVPA